VCLAALAWNVHPLWRAVVVANRDEFHARPAAALGAWPEAETGAAPILAGRDLQAGGAWFGLAQDRRFGLITNFREPAVPRLSAPTRGRLIPEYLQTARPAGQFLESIIDDTTTYAGFNLLLADAETLWYASNRAEPFARPLAAGVHALSNHVLDTPWPKLQRLRRALESWVAAAAKDTAPLWNALADRQRAAHEELPATGLTPEWEHLLSSPFVHHPEYGTRCSSILLIGHDGRVHFEERSFDAAGEQAHAARYTLPAEGWLESAAVAFRKSPPA